MAGYSIKQIKRVPSGTKENALCLMHRVISAVLGILNPFLRLAALLCASLRSPRLCVSPPFLIPIPSQTAATAAHQPTHFRALTEMM